ncbi:hypothetical protein B0H13DRAFT_813604 [Mycena leptocephala]|nr:hypothetical protein B0H13DRAFT_813604 [Mycena leptocephala]
MSSRALTWVKFVIQETSILLIIIRPTRGYSPTQDLMTLYLNGSGDFQTLRYKPLHSGRSKESRSISVLSRMVNVDIGFDLPFVVCCQCRYFSSVGQTVDKNLSVSPEAFIDGVIVSVHSMVSTHGA